MLLPRSIHVTFHAQFGEDFRLHPPSHAVTARLTALYTLAEWAVNYHNCVASVITARMGKQKRLQGSVGGRCVIGLFSARLPQWEELNVEIVTSKIWDKVSELFCTRVLTQIARILISIWYPPVVGTPPTFSRSSRIASCIPYRFKGLGRNGGGGFSQPRLHLARRLGHITFRPRTHLAQRQQASPSPVTAPPVDGPILANLFYSSFWLVAVRWPLSGGTPSSVRVFHSNSLLFHSRVPLTVVRSIVPHNPQVAHLASITFRSWIASPSTDR